MEASGIIFAALDCDHDAIEGWNRWYDLEHLPPNVAMDGVAVGHRYVATPALHERRVAAPGSGYADGLTSFATVYTLTGDPKAAFQRMTDLREELVANDRMFADEKKAVREGGVFELAWAVADPQLRIVERDIPFVEHTGFVVIQRGAGDQVDEWYRTTFAPRAVAVPGVNAVIELTSLLREAVALDLVLLEGDPVETTDRLRAAGGHHPAAEILVDAPFALIDPLRYPWADELRASDLPPTVSGA